MHTPYQERLNRPPDFEVTCSIFTKEESGRHSLPFQGIRWDFMYDAKPKTLHMIWPEFLDSEGNVILINTLPVPQYGRAFMWIIDDKMRHLHKVRIEIGTRSFFMEAIRKVGVCEVVRLIGL